MRYLVTGKAWKHHIAEDFTKKDNPSPAHPNGAGTGATIFLDFDHLERYLKEDTRTFYIAELDLKNEELNFNMGTDTLATTVRPILSERGFVPFNAAAGLYHIANSEFLCWVIGDGEYGSYFDGEIFMSRAVFTDYRPHAKQYFTIQEANYALEAVRQASDIEVRVLPQLIKYQKAE